MSVGNPTAKRQLPFGLFVVMVGVATELAIESVPIKLLHANDLIVMSKATEGHMNKLKNGKMLFESKGLKIKLWKSKDMASGNSTKDGLSKRKVEQCGVCGLRVKGEW